MVIEKQSSALKTAIGGTKALLRHMADYAPEVLTKQNVKSLGKLYLQGLFTPFKNIFTRGKAENELLQAVEKAEQNIGSNISTYLGKVYRKQLDDIVAQGPENFKQLTDNMKSIIFKKSLDPNIGVSPPIVRATIKDWPRLTARNYNLTGSFTHKTQPLIKLDDIGSTNLGALYHELGHLDRNTLLGKFLQKNAIIGRLDPEWRRLLEETRASYAGYRAMLQDGYTTSQAVGTLQGLPSYFYGALPHYTAKAGKLTGKYVLPGSAVGTGGYVLYNYLNNE